MLRSWQTLIVVTRRVLSRLKSHGVTNTLRIGLLRLHEILCDWRLGIETRGRMQFIAPEREDVCVGYEASDYSLIKRALCELRSRSSEVVFLDYGCGKGRTIVLAALQPFRHVIGVDMDANLLSTAERNLANVRPKVQCREVSLVNADATQFEVPDDVNVIFMFNPFIGEVMESVISRIEASLARNDRSITLIFLYPPHHVPNPFTGIPWFTELKELPVGEHRLLRLVVYEASLSNVFMPSAY